MKTVLTIIGRHFTNEYSAGTINIPLLIIILLVLLTALWICIVISKRNRLYLNKKEDKKDDKKENAYT